MPCQCNTHDLNNVMDITLFKFDIAGWACDPRAESDCGGGPADPRQCRERRPPPVAPVLQPECPESHGTPSPEVTFRTNVCKQWKIGSWSKGLVSTTFFQNILSFLEVRGNRVKNLPIYISDCKLLLIILNTWFYWIVTIPSLCSGHDQPLCHLPVPASSGWPPRWYINEIKYDNMK